MKRNLVVFVFIFLITDTVIAEIVWNDWDKGFDVTAMVGLNAYYMSVIGNGTWKWEQYVPGGFYESGTHIPRQYSKNNIDMNYSYWGVFLGFNFTSHFELTGELDFFSLYGSDGWFTEAVYYAGEGRSGSAANIYPIAQLIMVGAAFKYPLLRIRYGRMFDYFALMPTLGVDAVLYAAENIVWWPKIGLTIYLNTVLFIQTMYKFVISDLSRPGDTSAGNSYYTFENAQMFSIKVGFDISIMEERWDRIYYRDRWGTHRR
jgi:hypothetical protein